MRKPTTGPSNRIDNDNYSMKEAITSLLNTPDNNVLDIASGYFRLSALSTLKNILPKFIKKAKNNNDSSNNNKPVMRWLLSNRIDKKSSDLFGDKPIDDDTETYELNDEYYKQIKKWINEGWIEVRVFVGDEYMQEHDKNHIKFLHGKAYLFSTSRNSSRGSVIVGSSNFTKNGLQNNLELNIYSNDAWPAVNDWFNDIWNNYSFQYNDDLIDSFEQQRKKYSIPEKVNSDSAIKYFYWNLAKYYGEPENENLIGRINSIDSKLPYPKNRSGYRLFSHQRVGIEQLYNKLNNFDTSILCDGVGLGKTIEAAIIIKLILQDLNNQQKILILANGKLQKQWSNELRNAHVSMNKIDIDTYQYFTNHLNDDNYKNIAGKYALIIIDEAHIGYLKENNQSYKNMKKLIEYSRNTVKYPIKGLLLTATPWNNSREDIISLGKLFLNLNKVPNDREYKDIILKNNTRALYESGSSKKYNKRAYRKFWDDLFLQRNRNSLAKENSLDDKFPNRIFPLEEGKKQYKVNYSKDVSNTLQKLLYKMIDLKLPYQDTITQYFNFDHPASNILFRQRQQLLRRADSSNVSFQESLNNIFKRLLKFERELKRFQHNDVKIMRNYFISEVKSHHQNEEEYNTSVQKRINLVKQNVVELNYQSLLDTMLKDVHHDQNDLDKINKSWSSVVEHDDKRHAIFKQIKNEVLNKHHKVLLFSEFKPTVNDYYNQLLNDKDLNSYGIGMITGGNNEDNNAKVNGYNVSKTSALGRFSPNSKGYKLNKIDDEINILVGTDTLSTGQNLQDAQVIMTIELPYNPMRLEQRIGRIDRPKSNSENSIYIYAFPSDEIIDAEIALTDRYNRKVSGAKKDTNGDINLPFTKNKNDFILNNKSGVKQSLLNNESKRKIKQNNQQGVAGPSSFVSEQHIKYNLYKYYQNHKNDNFDLSNIKYGFTNHDFNLNLVMVDYYDVNNKKLKRSKYPLIVENDQKINLIKINDDVNMILNEEYDYISNNKMNHLIKINDKLLDKIKDNCVKSYNNDIDNKVITEKPNDYVRDLQEQLYNNRRNHKQDFMDQKIIPTDKFMPIIKNMDNRGYNSEQKQFIRDLRNDSGHISPNLVEERIWHNLKRFIEIFDKNSNISINKLKSDNLNNANFKNTKIKLLSSIIHIK